MRLAALKQFHWRAGIRHQIVDPDTDGLLTAALAFRVYGWPIMGFYNAETLWLDSQAKTPLDMESVAWVDLDMTWPGARSIGQHVTTAPESHQGVDLAFAVNPSQLRGVTQGPGYYWKYPFGSFQWLWWITNLSKGEARLDTAIGRGMAWLADGGPRSYDDYSDNLDHWRSTVLPGSLLDNLDPTTRMSDAAAASSYLADASGVDFGWKNDQWRMPAPRGGAAGGSPALLSEEITAILTAITGFYGWPTPRLPDAFKAYRGHWQSARERVSFQFPETRVIVSMAATRSGETCWTAPGRDAASEPGGLPPLTEALGGA
ncbi:hypothetical protein [Kytococcus sedentarius]|uniref:hypothetical protein n=1 Tax=Kytococcus sedentarius TaxID=1276 RepID=UPI0035BC1B86